MSDEFDPYLEWLEIPAEQQPPNHYALLGVEDREEDLEKIEESFHERYSMVRRYQVGEHGPDAVRVLQEMSKAFDCLTSPHHKKRYDRKLWPDETGQEDDEDDSAAEAKEKSKKKSEPADEDELAKFGDEQSASAPTAAPSLEILGPAPTTESPPALQPAAPQTAEAVWYVQTPDGRRLGPATQSQLDETVAQHGVNPQSMIWRTGWAQPAPATQVFPELLEQQAVASNNGSAPLKPYQGLPVRPEVGQSRKSVFFVVVFLGVASLGAAFFLNFAFSLDFILMAFAGFIGLVALAGGLLELGPLLNSPLGDVFRRKMGDESTRKLFAWIGTMCVLVSLSMIVFQTVKAAINRFRGVSPNLAQLPSVPNLPSVPLAAGGPSNAGGPPNVGRPNRTRPNGQNRTGVRQQPSGGGQVIPASGAAPSITGFSSYELKERQKLTIRGSNLSGVTKVIFARPGSAKSSSSALVAKFRAISDNELEVTAPLLLRLGRRASWVCEVHGNGGLAVSIPPDTKVVGNNEATRPNSVLRIPPGTTVRGALMTTIAVVEDGSKIDHLVFSRVYLIGSPKLGRACNANVLIGREAVVRPTSSSNTKIMLGGGISVFQQPKPFVVK